MNNDKKQGPHCPVCDDKWYMRIAHKESDRVVRVCAKCGYFAPEVGELSPAQRASNVSIESAWNDGPEIPLDVVSIVNPDLPFAGAEFRELLLGCGHSRDKRIGPPNTKLVWKNLTTLDCYSECKPDIVADLNILPWPIEDNSFDEIHAYEVLEHLGHQGNASEFFGHFTEIWRALKPNGILFATVPSRHSPWAWGDPSHTRVIQQESLVFLDQSEYVKNRKAGTSMSDFTGIWKGDFKVLASTDDTVAHIFALQAIKPARIFGSEK